MSSAVAAAVIAIHVLAGTFWLGTMLFTSAFLMPSLGVAGPAGGQIMKHIVQVRHLPAYMTTSVMLSLATGLTLFWQLSGGFALAWLTSLQGLVLTLGAVAAVAMAVVGAAVNGPTADKLGKIGAAVQAGGKPPSSEQAAEMRRLQHRLAHATSMAALTLALAVIAMVAWRYV
jgi:uncharacterized membrane protein